MEENKDSEFTDDNGIEDVNTENAAGNAEQCVPVQEASEIKQKKKKRRVSVGFTVFICLLTALITFQITFLAVANSYNKKYREALDANAGAIKVVDKLREVAGIYGESFIGEMDDEKTLHYVIDAYIASMDKYGSYMNQAEYAEMMTDYNAELEGIGVNVIYNGEWGAIEIVNVMPDSPALIAGVMPGDLIVYVEGTPVSELGYYPAIALIKGERGTYTHFTVYRGENYAETVEFTVMRDIVTEQTVLHHVIETDKTIGYIHILGFDNGTYDQFVSAVEDLRSQGCTRLVLDVRNNPGGLLTSVCDILDYILPEGPIVRLEDNKGNISLETSDKSFLDMDMVVVCNENTASAGELFTSSIKDYKAALIVGTVTYGKGTVQRIMQLSDGDALSISYKMYSPPYSDNFEGVGVMPDIIEEIDEELRNVNMFKYKDEEDNQLQRAITALNTGK